MSTLKEKFNNLVLKEFGGMQEPLLSDCEKIADDYAISFAEWLLWQDITQRGKNNFVCADGVQRSTKELLETFKKENGY